MGNLAEIQGTDIGGLTPAVDARKVEGQIITSGKNFKFDSDGPFSGFGDDFLTSIPLGTPDFVQSLKVDVNGRDRTFLAEASTILEWNEDEGNYDVIFIFPDTTTNPFRWTTAYLNNFVYFCHPAINGILFLSIITGDTGYITTAGVPQFPQAITENNGRLIVITPTLYQWSDPSNGQGWIPGTKGGAGFQVIADRVSGTPIMVASTGNIVLTFTTAGIMKSEFTGDFATYRHRALKTDYGPINSFCVAKTDDITIVILDRRGLFKSIGDAPSPYTAIFNEYLRVRLERDPFLFASNSRIDWDVVHQTLYLSSSTTDLQSLYQRAFVIYPALDKWGSFDTPFFGICGVIIPTGARRGDYFGYVDGDGRFRIWDFDAHKTDITIDTASYHYWSLIQYPVERFPTSVGHVSCASTARVSALNEFEEPGLKIGGGRSGYYTFDGGSLLAGVLQPLDAFVDIGLFRISTGTNETEETEIQDITLHSAPLPSMDLLDSLPAVPTFAPYKFDIKSTWDGVTAHLTTTPMIIDTKGGTIFYGVDGANGIWHTVNLRADAVGELFHLRYLEMHATLAGTVV